MAAAAKVCRDARAAERFSASINAGVGTNRGSFQQVALIDISVGGTAMRAAMDLPLGATVTINLPSLEPRRMLVVHRDHERYGCRFVEQLDANDLSQTIDAGARCRRAPIQMPEEASGYERTSASIFLAGLAATVVIVLVAMVALT